MIAALATQVTAYTTLDVDDAIARWNEGRFAALVDVRTQSEWDAGHLPNATFVESMNTNGDTSRLDGCQSCPIAVDRVPCRYQSLINTQFYDDTLTGRACSTHYWHAS